MTKPVNTSVTQRPDLFNRIRQATAGYPRQFCFEQLECWPWGWPSFSQHLKILSTPIDTELMF